MCTFEGYNKLTSFTMLNCGGDSRAVARGCADANVALQQFKVDNVNWVDIAPGVLYYLTRIALCELAGRIAVTEGQNVDAVLKTALLQKFGDVDDESNTLFVSYAFRSVTAVNITTQRFVIAEAGDYPYKSDIFPSTANNFKAVRWSVSDNELGVTVDADTGVLHVPAVGEESSNPTATEPDSTESIRESASRDAIRHSSALAGSVSYPRRRRNQARWLTKTVKP